MEQTLGGLEFDFALITTGPTFGRAPLHRKIANQEILSLDTGGHYRGQRLERCITAQHVRTRSFSSLIVLVLVLEFPVFPLAGRVAVKHQLVVAGFL